MKSSEFCIFSKFNIVGVISANVIFTNSYKFPPREKVTPKKANTYIERKVYYAGVFFICFV